MLGVYYIHERHAHVMINCFLSWVGDPRAFKGVMVVKDGLLRVAIRSLREDTKFLPIGWWGKWQSIS